MIAHIVLFQPRADVTPEMQATFAETLERACREIPGVTRATIGRALDLDVRYAGDFGAKAYNYSAVLEFADREGLLAYLSHPIHAELGRQFWQTCQSTVILDVEVADATTTSLRAFLNSPA